jgi:hypothetical protein
MRRISKKGLKKHSSNIDVSVYYTFVVIIVNGYVVKGPFKSVNCHSGNRK